MHHMTILLGLLALSLLSCNSAQNENHSKVTETDDEVKILGAMKDVMRKGKLGGRIHLDSIPDKIGLYGIGPEAYLKGELLIKNGIS